MTFARLITVVACAGLLGTGCHSSRAPTTAARSRVPFDDLLATPLPPADARLAYGRDSLQFGDLRLPRGRGAFPVAVVIHGGCWLNRYDLRHAAREADALTALGIATWTIEYRRVGDPGGGWPGTFDDVEAAIDHVARLAARYPLDTQRVVLVGHSAGGHLALWAAARSRRRAGALRVRGVVSLAGVTDPITFGARPGACSAGVASLLGGSPAEQGARYEAASPASLVPLGVPTRLVHGDSDTSVPLEQSQRFVARARAAGDDASLVVIPGGGHFDVVAPGSAAWPAVERAVRELLGRR